MPDRVSRDFSSIFHRPNPISDDETDETTFRSSLPRGRIGPGSTSFRGRKVREVLILVCVATVPGLPDVRMKEGSN